MSRAYGSSDEELKRALRDTDYGLCVFHANNDVNDHQIVNMEFEDGETVALSVNAFNIGGRYIRIYGTKGELYANMSDDFITVSTYEDLKTEKIPVVAADEMITGGHGGGDAGIIRDLYDYMLGDYHGFSVADIHTSVANHMIGFAAELPIPGLQLVPGIKAGASEDFALIAAQVPSAFFYLSAGYADEQGKALAHNPKVQFHEDVLPIGAALLAHCAMRWLA
jgi:predicted dehydrogenase